LTAHGKVDGSALVTAARGARNWNATPFPALAQNAFEAIVLDVFIEVLGQQGVGPDTDFFTAGGHSLLIMRVLNRLEQLVGVRLEPSVFFEAPTPRGIGRAIEERASIPAAERDGASHSIIRVSTGSRPLFFVPGGEGGDFSLGIYARLALHLPGRAFYGLLLASADRRIDRRDLGVEEMAASCVQDLLRVAPEGPFELAGGCIGGIVAHEMARQLEAIGRPPASVVMLDTAFPSQRQLMRMRARRWSAAARRHVGNFLRASTIRRSLQDRLYRRVSAMLPYPEIQASPLAPREWFDFGDSIVRHKVRATQTPTVLLATDELARTGAPDRWRAALGDRLTVCALPGTHWSFIRSDINEAGTILRRALDEGGR
jgi:thioesterase domain-containing protein